MLEGVFLNISNIEWIEKLNCLTDLHVHLDGSLSPESVRHLCGMQNIETGDDAELSAKLSVSSDCKNLNEYLEKFEFPLQLLQTREAVKYSVCQLVKEQEEQGVIYSEIRFAPQLHTEKDCHSRRLLKQHVRDLMNQESTGSHIPVTILYYVVCVRMIIRMLIWRQ